MSLAEFATDDSIQPEKDMIGGNGPVDSDLYGSTITMAYRSLSKGGAHALNLHLAAEDGREIRQVIYFTSGTAKGGKHFTEKNGVKNYLPGFNLVNSLCLLSIGEEFAKVNTEKKLVPIYNFDERKEIPTEVEVLTPLLGQDIIAGIVKQVVDKNSNIAAEGEKPNWQPTGDTKEENEIDKFFRARDKMTTAEILGGAEEAGFYTKWGEKNIGVTKMRAKGATNAPAANSAFGGAAAAKPAKSIFA
jgi:hypothetical protein